MADEKEKVDPLFVHLVLSLYSAAWYQMGKMVSPVSGKIEKNLDEARISIDLLTMLQEKTKGNLLPDEKKYLDNSVYTLQMNYIDEAKEADKKDETGASKSSETASETAGETGPEKTSTDGGEDEGTAGKKE